MVDSSPIGGLFTAMQALAQSEEKTLKAVEEISSGDFGRITDGLLQLKTASIEHKANAHVVRSLDENLGNLIDMLA